MALDGEWRVAFLADEHPELKYGTAPMPVDDAHPELYGSGYINGTIIGIPKGGKHQAEAWALVRVPDDGQPLPGAALERAAERPVDDQGLADPPGDQAPDQHFSTFLKIFGHLKSGTSPITASGVVYTNSVQNFFLKWQAGTVTDLRGGFR